MPNTPFVKRVRRQDDNLAVIGREDFVSTSELTRVKKGFYVSDLGMRGKKKDFKLGRRKKGPSSRDEICFNSLQ